ncbi:hypothetical protein AVEN_97888-1 [Araneus ventricosus]|uniref:Uncharacterized protein n=1 Tax=Araneus ventricosus TaxID=182803 RepID=A0A4Y2F3K8_ARAVE|nr:hypothetical protein AVEN_97888-1 [Araneus ventricosus]
MIFLAIPFLSGTSVDARNGKGGEGRKRVTTPLPFPHSPSLTTRREHAEDTGGKRGRKRVEKNSPNEILAVAAERGLLEKSRYEPVVLYTDDVLLLEGPLPGPGSEGRGPHAVVAAPHLLTIGHLAFSPTSLATRAPSLLGGSRHCG